MNETSAKCNVFGCLNSPVNIFYNEKHNVILCRCNEHLGNTDVWNKKYVRVSLEEAVVIEVMNS